MSIPQHFGVFLGRLMPMHNGHNSVIQQIIREGLTPLIILGGADRSDDRHPLSVTDRITLIRQVYPESQAIISSVDDYPSWDDWYTAVIDTIERVVPKDSPITMYSHEKDEDIQSFVFAGKQYVNCSSNKVFEVSNIPVRLLPAYHDREGNVVSATQIRADKQYARNHLDARVYNQLKGMQWWE